MNKVSKREIFPFFIPSNEEYSRAKIFLAMGKDRHKNANIVAIYEFYHNLNDMLVCPDRIVDKRKSIKAMQVQKNFDSLKKAQKDLHLEVMDYYGFGKKVEKIAKDML